MLELKELLKLNSTLRVILMSATINHETFVRYFSDAPLLSISGFTHPVTDMWDLFSVIEWTREADNRDDRFLEDFINLINYYPSANRSGKKQDDEDLLANREEYLSVGLDERSATAVQAISRSDRVDYAVRLSLGCPRFFSHLCGQLITATINHIISKAEEKGGILVFLPGVQEIRQCIDSLQGSPSASQAKIFPLHANLSNDEQRVVFAPTSKWKIVVATNVAEVLLPAIRHPPHIFDLNAPFCRLLSQSTTLSTSLTQEESKRRNTTRRAVSQNSSSNGSPALQDDNAGGVQGARARVCAISSIHAGASARWSSSHVPRFYESR